jgi:hypothetical protein
LNLKITEITIDDTTLRAGQIATIRASGNGPHGPIQAGTITTIVAIGVQQLPMQTENGLLIASSLMLICNIDGHEISLPPEAFKQTSSLVIA